MEIGTQTTPLEAIHQAAMAWADDMEPKLQQSIAAVGLLDTGALQRSLRPRTFIESRRTEVVSVGFQFLRYGVWRLKGASRGHGGSKGSTWRSADGRVRRTAQTSLGKLGERADWYNPVLRREIDNLEAAIGQAVEQVLAKSL